MPAPTPTSDPKALTAELLGNVLSYVSSILEREIEESETGFGGYLLEFNSIKRMKCIVLLQKGRCVCDYCKSYTLQTLFNQTYPTTTHSVNKRGARARLYT
jgi:hypothetical protein